MRQEGFPISTSAAILLGAVVVSISILISGGIIKIGKPANVPAPVAPTAQNQAPQATPAPTVAKVSIDDDPVLGNKNAKVTLIEFSDYECPFCKRHFDQVYPQIKKDYIDTGKVKLVFRDFIAVPGHNPLATTEAIAANCAREQGGDEAYYKYHDEIFKRTTSGGNGLVKDALYAIASENGLNATNFKSCLDSEKNKEEITKDQTDGSAAGVSGTPSFFVGLSDPSGTITGTILVGAQPYTAFQAAIDPLLK